MILFSLLHSRTTKVEFWTTHHLSQLGASDFCLRTAQGRREDGVAQNTNQKVMDKARVLKQSCIRARSGGTVLP